MSKNKTLLVIDPSEGKDTVYNLLVAETGEHLASHFCTNETFAYNDLYGNREKRKKEYEQRFGEVEVKFLDDIEGLDDEEMLRRNQEFCESQEEKDGMSKEDGD